MFDEQFSTEKLEEIGNPLAMVSKVIDFKNVKRFAGIKVTQLKQKNNAGGKPYEVVLMFKILILQRYNGLASSTSNIR